MSQVLVNLLLAGLLGGALVAGGLNVGVVRCVLMLSAFRVTANMLIAIHISVRIHLCGMSALRRWPRSMLPNRRQLGNTAVPLSHQRAQSKNQRVRQSVIQYPEWSGHKVICSASHEAAATDYICCCAPPLILLRNHVM
jgi:hypothetical protein